MSAVGALHLANTTTGRDRSIHLHHAMKTYGEIMQSLRQVWGDPKRQFQLTDFATCLLLCIFEMLDSQIENWKVHLAGARDIFESIVKTPTTATVVQKQIDGLDRPFKCILISLMAYLDVVGAVSTNERMVIGGSYLEMHGEQEYNFGISTIATERTIEDVYLGGLRHAWSVLMSIKADISAFGDAINRGLSPKEQHTIRQGLEDRLSSWKALAPDCFAQIGSSENMSDEFGNITLLESMACVKAHEQATIIYLHRVAMSGQQVSRPSPPHVQIAACQVLALARKFVKGVGRLAMLWNMYMAGLEVTDGGDQAFVREWYQETEAYGFRTADKALLTLEDVWNNKAASEMHGWIEAPNIKASLLLPLG
ncbi:uncharacterized protein GIQ15_04509 [Arthroderma uncinatum]|uniref:uncharacterized protein n=1 Tax=Arthroderma uncinatum TaxID=74035 RepID=UPI00144AA28B|nr:uncharacterized protein GIQ15_04509 [Arthroderma uncinatum]KAF3481750.1 hypothetical protein GIQ15_04509 [Arthroderma uncinatum]